MDSTEVPELGACRMLTPADVEQPANATRTVDCEDQHTAETFAIGELPDEFDDVEYDDRDLGEYAYRTCMSKFEKFLGATTRAWCCGRSSAGRGSGRRRRRGTTAPAGTAATWWAATRPATEYRPLPPTAKGLLLGRPDDRWLVCATGATVAEGEKVPCAQDHDWRAATTIKLGEPEDKYPGDEVVASRTKAFCATSIKAWLNYPAQFEYAFTHFHEAEWQAGNRRSVCWAKTSD